MSTQDVPLSLLPLSELIDLLDFPLFEHLPIDLADKPEALQELFESIRCADASTSLDGPNLVIEMDLFFGRPLPFLQLPGLDAFDVRIGGTEEEWGRARALLKVGPDLALTLTDIAATLTIAPSILARTDDPSKGAELTVTGGFSVTSSAVVLRGFEEADLKPASLAGTELIISATGIQVIDDNRSDGSAIAMAQATVQLPLDWVQTDSGDHVEIRGEDIRIGPSGLTGRFLHIGADPVTGTLCGFAFRLRNCELQFEDNAVVKAALRADIHLSALDEGARETWIGIEVSFGPGGVQAALLPASQQPARQQQDDEQREEEGDETDPDNVEGAGSIFAVTIQGVMRLGVKALRLTQEPDEWVMFLSGVLTPLIEGGEDWPSLMFDEIGIGSSSGFLLPEGAGIATTAPLVAKWHFVTLTITAFRLARPRGSPRALELSLTGAVKLLDGLPAGVSVEGLVVTWHRDTGDIDVRFDGLGVEFGLPGGFRAGIELAFSAAPAPHFKGHGFLDLESLDLRLDILIEAGRAPTVDGGELVYLFLKAETEAFPGGIPIGATGLSLYGVSGLLAYNMTLDVGRHSEAPPHRRYYRLFADQPIGLTEREKWVVRAGAALGLGAVVGTADDGTLLHCKGIFLLTLPDLTLLLQARADIIERKPALKDEKTGSIDALLTYLPTDNVLTFDLDVQWSKGDLFTVGGAAHALFRFDDPLAFRLELGQEPPGLQIAARALRAEDSWLLDTGYWMRLDRRGMATGVLAHFGKRYEVAGFWAEISGSLRAGMGLFWDAPQWEGSAAFDGFAGLGCDGLSLGVGIAAQVDVCVQQPLRFIVNARACITIDVWFDSWEICLAHRFAWVREEPPALVDPFIAARAEPRLWMPRAKNGKDEVDDGIVDLASGPPGGGLPAVWPHSVLTIEFAKPMMQEAPVFGGYEAVLPVAVAERSGYTASYVLTRVELVCESNPGASLTLFGTWTKSPASRPDPETGRRHEPRPPNTCLQLLSSDRFGRRGSLSGGGAENIGLDYCARENAQETVCVPLAGMFIGSGRLQNGWPYVWLLNNESDPRADDRDNAWGILYAPFDQVRIYLPEDVKEIEAHLAEYAPDPPPPDTYQRATLSRPANGWLALPSAWAAAQRVVVELCYKRLRTSAPGSVVVTERVGSGGREEWSIRPEDRLLRPGETYRLEIQGERRLRGGTNRTEPFSHLFRFKVLPAPEYPDALGNAIAGVYPSDSAQPVYTGYDFIIRFKEDFVPALYAVSGRRLVLRLVDGRGKVVRNPQGHPILAPVVQVGQTLPAPTERWWRATYMRDPVNNCIVGPPIVEKGETELALPLENIKLQPTTRYTVQLIVVSTSNPTDDHGASVLATWSFTTSAFTTFSALFGRPSVDPRGVRFTALPDANEFDAIARACGVPITAVARETRLMPIFGPRGLSAFLIEAPEPLDDESGRLSVTVAGRLTQLFFNRNRTRLFAMIGDNGGSPPWLPTSVDLKVVWNRDPRDPADEPELRRRVNRVGGVETIDLPIRLELP
jgi:hypothetical protein